MQLDSKTDSNLIEMFQRLTIALDSSADSTSLAGKLSMNKLGLK